ncbi:MAG: hypothetical protein ACC645_19240 [Pirellulales bacterium]
MWLDVRAGRSPRAAVWSTVVLTVALHAIVASTHAARPAPTTRPSERATDGPRRARTPRSAGSSSTTSTTTSSRATSGRSARRQSLRAIPLHRLSGEDLEKVRFVLSHTTIYRRMPTKVIDCDPRLFTFLARHPEVIVNIWEVLGISNVALERTAERTFRASDGHGTLGQVEIISDERNRQLIYAEGTYEGPMFKLPVRARCVMLMRSSFAPGDDGRHYVTAQLEGFIHIDGAAADLLLRTFQPLVGRTADYNFTETMAFVGNLSRTTERNPLGVERLYRRLNKVEPETRRRLVEISRNLATRSAPIQPTGVLEIARQQDPRHLVERVSVGQ